MGVGTPAIGHMMINGMVKEPSCISFLDTDFCVLLSSIFFHSNKVKQSDQPHALPWLHVIVVLVGNPGDI